MPAAYITPGPVQAISVALLVVGLGALAYAHRSDRLTPWLAGAGALLATFAVVTASKAFFSSYSDGPTGWTSVRWIYASMFDSWPYVFVVGLCAAALWVAVERLISHRWSPRTMTGVLLGSLLASVVLGLLDASI